MLYRFENINSEEIYTNCRVMFIAGQYNIFNKIVSDKLRDISTADADIDMNVDVLKEFDVDVSTDIKVSNTVDLETFMYVIGSPSINGKWFTSVNLDYITKKQSDWVKEYIKNPSDNGILVLIGVNYKDYKFWLSNKIVATSPYVHLIQLSFPRRDTLGIIVTNLFLKRNARIESRALELFILRMSSAYDDYEQVIDKICSSSLPEGYMNMNILDVPVITYDQAFNALKGIENFVLDDFIWQLTRPMMSDKPKAGSVIYKMLGYLTEEYGARKLVSMLLSKIDEIIEFRMAINSGKIPIIVNYNVAESKKLLGEESSIAEKSDFQFKRLAKIASQTSLQDWGYMKLILMNTSKFDENSYLKALYSLISRSVLTESRLNNDIMVDNIINCDLDYINKVRYIDTSDVEDDRMAVWNDFNGGAAG